MNPERRRLIVAELREARIISTLHRRTTGHNNATRCTTCSIWGDIVEYLERLEESEPAEHFEGEPPARTTTGEPQALF